MKWVTIIFLFSLLFICNMQKEDSNTGLNERSMNQPSKDLPELKEAVLKEGNANAYRELSVAYLDITFQEEFLFYALIMANKHDYTQAYFDVFTCLTDYYLFDINQIDETTASLAIGYLLKAYEKGHHQAKEMVDENDITSCRNSKQQIKKIFVE